MNLPNSEVTLTVSGEIQDLRIEPGYVYDPQTVYKIGVSYISFQKGNWTVVSSGSEMSQYYNTDQRPQFHFSQIKNWINDPCGLSYWNGYYHLYQQFDPFHLVMESWHWGHAVSTDLFHWKILPIALFPEEVKYGPFTGSATVLYNNTLMIMFTDADQFQE